MMEWIPIASVEAFPPGTRRTLDIEGLPVAVYNVEGRYFAIGDICTHELECLSDGLLEGLEIVCPRHGAHFSLVTGMALSPPAYEPVPTFPVRVEDGVVEVGTTTI